MFLKSNDKSSNFDLIETYREGARTFCVVSSKTEAQAQDVKALSHELGYHVLGSCVRDGRPSLAFYTNDDEKSVVGALTKGAPTTEIKTAKPVNMWFIRGFMGFTGQLFNLAHSILLGDKALGSFAYLNLGANGMAMAFGAQKASDESTLERIGNEFDHLSSQSGHPVDATVPHTHLAREQTKGPAKKDSEAGKDESGVMGFIRANSVKVQHTLRLIASSIVFNDGLKQLKEQKLSGQGGKLPPRLVAGALILPGKVIGILAKDEDPNLLSQEKKGFWHNFKVNANQIGSLIELTGFTILAYEGISGKKTLTPEKLSKMSPNTVSWSKKLKAETGWLQAFGQTLFVASYMVQSVAPLSKRVFPMERALQSASLHLQALPDQSRDQVAVSMAYNMYNSVPQLRREGFAKTLAQIQRVAESPDQIEAASIALSGKKSQPGPNTAEISPPPRVDQTALASRDAENNTQGENVQPATPIANTDTTRTLALDGLGRSANDGTQPEKMDAQSSVKDTELPDGHLARLEAKRGERGMEEELPRAKPANIREKRDASANWQSKATDAEREGYALAK